jgi:hypothetical protein
MGVEDVLATGFGRPIFGRKSRFEMKLNQTQALHSTKMRTIECGDFRDFPESFAAGGIRRKISIVRKMTLGTHVASMHISRNTRPQLPGGGCPRGNTLFNDEQGVIHVSTQQKSW